MTTSEVDEFAELLPLTATSPKTGKAGVAAWHGPIPESCYQWAELAIKTGERVRLPYRDSIVTDRLHSAINAALKEINPSLSMYTKLHREEDADGKEIKNGKIVQFSFTVGEQRGRKAATPAAETTDEED